MDLSLKKRKRSDTDSNSEDEDLNEPRANRPSLNGNHNLEIPEGVIEHHFHLERGSIVFIPIVSSSDDSSSEDDDDDYIVGLALYIPNNVPNQNDDNESDSSSDSDNSDKVQNPRQL